MKIRRRHQKLRHFEKSGKKVLTSAKISGPKPIFFTNLQISMLVQKPSDILTLKYLYAKRVRQMYFSLF